MAVIKCKMCGGELELIPGSTVAKCEYCGSTQTVPSADDEKRLLLFERAERLRRNCEFDKAFSVYESIVADFRDESEAYWGLVLCKYGIEYVDDPATGKKIPTCHRSSFESVMEDANFEQVLENADLNARKVYRDEAKQIEELRKGILEVSSREAPYDIFICYKETAPDGGRTEDSVMAQDIYDALTEKGYRVFFSRISLEDKLGQEYEPYIFAALHSAKIMLAIGTDYEYYNAVWVKNEWSRFLQLIARGEKKTLIPCYKGIDAYDMPKEFSKLQAQDMGKLGAMQDLLRGIDKLLETNKPAAVPTPTVQTEDVTRIYTYNNALEKMQDNTIASLTDAVSKLQSLGDWNDAPAKLGEAQALLNKAKKKKATKRTVTLSVIGLIILGIAGGIFGIWFNQQTGKYDKAVEAMAYGDYANAVSRFNNLGSFKDTEALRETAAEASAVQDEAMFELFGHSDPSMGFVDTFVNSNTGNINITAYEINGIRSWEWGIASFVATQGSFFQDLSTMPGLNSGLPGFILWKEDLNEYWFMAPVNGVYTDVMRGTLQRTGVLELRDADGNTVMVEKRGNTAQGITPIEPEPADYEAWEMFMDQYVPGEYLNAESGIVLYVEPIGPTEGYVVFPELGIEIVAPCTYENGGMAMVMSDLSPAGFVGDLHIVLDGEGSIAVLTGSADLEDMTEAMGFGSVSGIYTIG